MEIISIPVTAILSIVLACGVVVFAISEPEFLEPRIFPDPVKGPGGVVMNKHHTVDKIKKRVTGAIKKSAKNKPLDRERDMRWRS